MTHEIHKYTHYIYLNLQNVLYILATNGQYRFFLRYEILCSYVKYPIVLILLKLVLKFITHMLFDAFYNLFCLQSYQTASIL